MNYRYILLKIIFLSCLLFEVCHSQETNVTTCLPNNLSPDDEPEDGNFIEFANLLEKYTGLDQSGFNVSVSCRGRETPCIINPNGSAIWEARMDLYMNNMMHTNDGSKTTLDGCLCFSTNITDFQDCMTQVREEMIVQLDSVLLENFKFIVESDCNSFEENCVVSI